MLTKDTLRFGVYSAAAVLILALTGMFGKFAERVVFGGSVTLSQIVLVLVILLSSLAVAGQSKSRSLSALTVNALWGALAVGLMLLVLAWIEGQTDLSFVFANLKPDPIAPEVFFGQPIETGALVLLGLSVVVGLVVAGLLQLSDKLRRVLLLGLGATVTVGLLEAQINNVLTLADALALVALFAVGYVIALRGGMTVRRQLLVSAGIGIAVGVVLGFVAGSDAFQDGKVLGRFEAGLVAQLALAIVFAAVSALGVTAANAGRGIHDSIVSIMGLVLLLGVLNWQSEMTWLATAITLVISSGLLWFSEDWGGQALQRFEALPRPDRQTLRRYSIVIGLIVMLVLPAFVGQYISSIADLVGLYVIMGIGLNVVVGYAGLLDLGYVAFFALGAYTIGTLTTPSLITCGVLPKELTAEQIQTTCNVLNFWQAWPVAILVSGLAGVLLGIPVLRLRGDYLAIVTLGFGEIVRLITLSNTFKPLFGGASGIGSIPGPVLDLTFLNPAWKFELGNALNIYYVVLVAIVVVAFITLRLGGSRLGRAWRAMRADEDVAQAMGINLTQTKLLAFATGAAFAGMGGAVFGSWLHGIFPNSFGLLVSINVLALIIIGGLGSIPGVVLGAFMLLGLPEALRELQDYRLLAFGVLLVVTMLMKPAGLIPPPVRRLSELVERKKA